MEIKEFNDYAIDIGPMGPIGEGETLILRATRNCPWNKCLFCPAYKGRKFVYRNVPEIKRDIDTAARSKTCAQRSLKELEELNEAGFSWLFVGVESGCDEVLKFMPKGVTGEELCQGVGKV